MPDESLTEILHDPASTIDEVLQKLELIDSALSGNDGLKWFNLLYLMVTKEIIEHPPEGGWSDPAWIAELDVIFANLYFDALRVWLADAANTTKSWKVLFSEREDNRVMRVQFALCGMNAHINRDLQVALFDMFRRHGFAPEHGSGQHRDFEYVNDILETVEPRALEFLATGIVGMFDEGLGQLDNIIGRWSVRTARETAWFNAEILWTMRKSRFLQTQHLRVVDQYTSFAGRLLIVPI
jgi:hypothetical protein